MMHGQKNIKIERQSGKVVFGNNWYLMWTSYEIHKYQYTVCKNVVSRRVHKNFENRILVSSRLSVRSNSAPTGRISIKFYISIFYENRARKFKFHYYLTRTTGTLHEDRYTFSITSRSVLLRTTQIANKICSENQKHFMSIELFLTIMLFMRSCGKMYSRAGHRWQYGARVHYWDPINVYK